MCGEEVAVATVYVSFFPFQLRCSEKQRHISFSLHLKHRTSQARIQSVEQTVLVSQIKSKVGLRCVCLCCFVLKIVLLCLHTYGRTVTHMKSSKRVVFVLSCISLVLNVLCYVRVYWRN